MVELRIGCNGNQWLHVWSVVTKGNIRSLLATFNTII